MTAINSALSSLVNRHLAANVQASAAQSAQTQSSGGGFANAVNLNLTAPAQAVMASQGAGPSGSGGKAGEGMPVGVQSSSSGSGSAEETLLVEEAKQQVIPKVGVAGADKVVDSKGDIDQVELNKLIAQQEAQQAAKLSTNG
jgi:hypothetical protein